MRRFLKISLIIILCFQAAACGEKPSRRKRGKKENVPEAVVPPKNAKIAFIFPAGAGAMHVILGIAEKMEKDLGISHLGSIMDMAGGVSSGMLTGSALTFGGRQPKYSAGDFKPKVAPLIKKVFPDVNDMVDKLIADYKFTLDELNAIFTALINNPPTGTLTVQAAITAALTNASQKKPALVKKIGDSAALMVAVAPFINIMVGIDRAAKMKDAIENLLGDTDLSDPNNANVIGFSSSDRKPVFFAPAEVVKLLPGSYAEGSTKLYKALIASSAIPGFIKAPTDINFYAHDGSGPNNIPELIDGVFALPHNIFDPSAMYYDIFKEQFAGQDLLMIFIGNGARFDAEFRKKHKFSRGVAQTTDANNKQITFVAIDARILDGRHDIFDLSQFYASDAVVKHMDAAVDKATKSASYQWAIKAISATR